VTPAGDAPSGRERETPAVSLYSPPPPPDAAKKTAMGSPGPAHARGELRTMSAGFPATRVVGCGETHSRVLASCAASSPDTVCRETVVRQPTREPLASLTVMGESDPTCSGPTNDTDSVAGVTVRVPGKTLMPMVCVAGTPGLPVARAMSALCGAGGATGEAVAVAVAFVAVAVVAVAFVAVAVVVVVVGEPCIWPDPTEEELPRDTVWALAEAVAAA
jgi:hypothetical protein